MNSKKTIWGSVGILVGVVVAILAFVRGPLLLPLLIATFAVWGLWLLWTQVLPFRRTMQRQKQKAQTESINRSGIQDPPPLPIAGRHRADGAAPGGVKMTNRKHLYGYRMEKGEMTVVPEEKVVVERIAGLYTAGASYQAIADSLNKADTPFSPQAPLWNRHKVKRLLENPRYIGTKGYPAILEVDTFQAVQAKIRTRTEGYAFKEKRPALKLKDYLRCPCGGSLQRVGGTIHRKDTLYLKCAACGAHVTILDEDLLAEVSRQMEEYNAPKRQPYVPDGEVIRLTNAINRGLEHPDAPEDVVALILRGVSARYDCCPAPMEQENNRRLSEADLKRFGQAASHITITGNLDVTVHFK